MVRKVSFTIGLAFCFSACGQDCLVPPCPLPIAVAVTMTSASSGGKVTGATVVVSAPVQSTIPCDSACLIAGLAGTYTLTANAPGYQSLARTVVVQGTSPTCGCPSAQTERVSFTLTLTP
jgi:hypothetical protein